MTLQSMTGFGRAQIPFPQGLLSVELRSVNQKGLDVKVRAPRDLGPVEVPLQKKVKGVFKRGRVEVTVAIQWDQNDTSQVKLDQDAALSMLQSLQAFAIQHQLDENIPARDFLRVRELWQAQEAVVDEDATHNALDEAMAKALQELLKSRETEGAALGKVLAGHIDVIEELSTRIEKLSKAAPGLLLTKLKERLEKLTQDTPVDEQRLAQEIALLAERVDTTEETDRLRMHVQHARELLDNGSPVGRKVDFLCQEFLREANTCGSKCQDAQVAHLVVELKTEVERFREQIQNLE
ncbi:MAG: YicC family protein [Deltaproteobacteria bacterium]|nr:YicC family protein [Deltaproteobacteria bacterium]